MARGFIAVSDKTPGQNAVKPSGWGSHLPMDAPPPPFTEPSRTRLVVEGVTDLIGGGLEAVVPVVPTAVLVAAGVLVLLLGSLLNPCFGATVFYTGIGVGLIATGAAFSAGVPAMIVGGPIALVLITVGAITQPIGRC